MVQATRLKAEEVQRFLESSGVTAWLCSAWEGDRAKALLNGTDLLVTVGGDGTILRAAQVALPEGTPITGINMGKLGFMTELGADEAIEKLPLLLGGEGWTDERTMLQAELVTAGGSSSAWHALNDVVVARGAVVRVINVEASIDGQHLTTYRADGVIVATATGSTGYSLAAGGPILYPRSADKVLVPVMPHLAPAFPLLLPGAARVRLGVNTVHQATLSIDGHINLPVSSGDVVTVTASPHTTRFLRIQPETQFYSSLEMKLKGKRSNVPGGEGQDQGRTSDTPVGQSLR